MSDHYKTDGMIIRNQDGDCMGIFSAVSLLNDKINQLTSQDKTIKRLEKQLEVAMAFMDSMKDYIEHIKPGKERGLDAYMIRKISEEVAKIEAMREEK
jgi:hypothetical protein